MIGSTLGLVGAGVFGLSRLGRVTGAALPPAVGAEELDAAAQAYETAERPSTTTTTTLPPAEGLLTFPVDPASGLLLLDNFGGDSVSQGPCKHKGVDVFPLTDEVGIPLLACVDGIFRSQRFAGSSGAQGNAVILEDANGDIYRYHHLDSVVEDLEVGSPVVRGQVIGYMGKTGNANFPHLHFEVRRGSTVGPAVNPVPLISLPVPGVTKDPRDGCDDPN